MGTVYDQIPRDPKTVSPSENDAQNSCWYYYEEWKDKYKAKMTFSEFLKIFEILEYGRRTDIMVWDGDTWDEQISGIARILDRIADALENKREDQE